MLITDFLLHIPIFSELNESTLKKIVNIGTRKVFEKNDVILLEEDAGTALFIILKGKVKITRSSSDGREVILNILSDSDFFGEMAILDGLNRSATVIAIENSELFLIQIKALSLKDAEGKVASVILQLADDIGKIQHGKVEIDKLPLQQDLANMAGTSRETISRTLHLFTKKGLIEIDANKLKILDYEKFKEAFS